MASSNTTKTNLAKTTDKNDAGEGSSSKQAETTQESTTKSATPNTTSTGDGDKLKKAAGKTAETDKSTKQSVTKDAEKTADTKKSSKKAVTKQKSTKEAANSKINPTKKVTFLKAKNKKRVVSESSSAADDDSDSSDSDAERKKLKEKIKKAKTKSKDAGSKKKLDPEGSDSDSSDVEVEKKKSKNKAKKSKGKAEKTKSKEETDSSDSDSYSSGSEAEKKKPKKKAKKSTGKAKADASDSSSDSSDSSDSENAKTKEKSKKSKQKEKEEKANANKKEEEDKAAKKKEEDEKTKADDKDDLEKAIAKKLGIFDLIATKEATKVDDAATKQQLAQQQLLIQLMQQQMQQQTIGGLQTIGTSTTPAPGINSLLQLAELLAVARKEDNKTEDAKNDEPAKEPEKAKEEADGEKKEIVRASVLDYKRIDQVYDRCNNYWKYQITTDDKKSYEYDQYIFNVRRMFNYDGKYCTTSVDVKSKLLIEALKEVMDGIEGLSLVDDTPMVDPDLLFLYLEDLRKLCKQLKKTKVKAKKHKKRAKKDNETKRTHLKLLLKYLDAEYSETKKSLYPMLEAGLITFDYLWALWKPNTVAWATTYDTPDQPRAFKIISYEKKKSITAGEYYTIVGKYLEYDGKVFGMGEIGYSVFNFKGATKITSLDCYPIIYHKDETKVRAELIARGKKFVSLHGVQYKCHEGLAYVKKRNQIIKINIDSRIMVDPAIFRRTLPNYQISAVKAQDPDIFEVTDEEEDSEEMSSDDEKAKADKPKIKKKVIQDSSDSDQFRTVYVPVNEDGMEIVPEKLATVISKKRKGTTEKKAPPKFKDEEYLIASPVVLGFSFTEKSFLEFTVSGVKEIIWNEGSYESLVLPENTKAIVQGLVESHKNHPEEGIDDVIQGKGKGLVAVLHGPPGTGKTLTAEGISELLKCPLYMVSVGELGTNPKTLEIELQRVLDIAHSWGAVLLLDEADVFLEQRTVRDIHRNALVSVFLRLLEYFQGILFLTTNRVATFDEAFQSRIHIALKYGELDAKAKRAVFKLFIERVRVSEGLEIMPFTEMDLDKLVSHDLNGRQIKNTVRTAQALAINKSEPLGMEHLERVLAVSKAFDEALHGGAAHNGMFM